MPLKVRHGRPYYYHARRRGDRVVSEYVAAGAEAEAEAERVRAERSRRAAERRSLVDLARRSATRDAALGAIIGSALRRLGYYRHHRGEWRRKDKAMGATATTTGPGGLPGGISGDELLTAIINRPPEAGRSGTDAEVDRAELERQVQDSMESIIGRAVAGDPEAMEGLDTMLVMAASQGEGTLEAAITVMGGDAAWHAQFNAIQWASSNPAQQKALTLKLDRLARQVAGPEPPPVVRLLAERVALAWLDLHTWDARHFRMLDQPDGIAVTTDAFYQRGRNQALRRYIASIKGLAQIQALTRPRSITVTNHQEVRIEE